MSKKSSKIIYTYEEDGLECTGETPMNQTSGDTRLIELISRNKILSIHSGERTLNDIFVELTGRQLQ
jgi:fluoroquinolone transport system ATP-binding protein